MKVVLEVKNISKVVKPSTNHVMLYDGKQWYITTKQDLFKEYDEKIKELELLKKENEKFKKDVLSQLMKMGEIIKKLYSK